MAQEAARLAPQFERDEDPAEALLSLLRTSRARALYWEDQITRKLAPLHTVGPGGEHRPSVEVTLWENEKDRSEKVATSCIRLGLEERRVRVAEGVGDAMFVALEAALQAAGVALESEAGRSAFEAGAFGFERALGAGESHDKAGVR